MSREKLLQPLHNLLIKAQALLILSQAENADTLQIPFAEYQLQMSLFADPAYIQALRDANLADEAQALILQLQNFNQQIEERAANIYANIASELRQIIQADKALDAYRR